MAHSATAVEWERIVELDSPYPTPSGREYTVRVEGIERADGTWAGRIVFTAGGDIRVTDEESSQPSRDALAYWATELETVYLDGAFARATP